MNILRKYIDIVTESTQPTNSMGQPIHPTPEGITNFEKWSGGNVLTDSSGRPQVFYHGTTGDIQQFSSGIAWFSKLTSLANDYADYRMGMDGNAPGNVVPVYLKSAKQFNADVLPRSCKITQFFSALLNQSGVDPAKLKPYMEVVRNGALEEESGPHYSIQDFWYHSSSYFGSDGAMAITSAFKVCGFDSITYTEGGHETVGVMSATQVKSAVGNRGTFSTTNPNIVES